MRGLRLYSAIAAPGCGFGYTFGRQVGRAEERRQRSRSRPRSRWRWRSPCPAQLCPQAKRRRPTRA